VDYVDEAAASAVAQMQEADAAPPLMFAISEVIGHRKGQYQVLWEDGSKTSEALSQDKVWAVWEPTPQEKALGDENYMLHKFILVDFTRVRKHLGRVESYNSNSRKYYVVYEDGKDSGFFDLLAAEKPWSISNQTF
jgi:hypothetical protein